MSSKTAVITYANAMSQSRCLFLFLVSLIISIVFEITMVAAQGLDTDSLKNLITKTNEDTTRILLISSLCNELARYEPDSAIRLAKDGLKLAGQIQYAKGEADLKIALGIALANVGDYANSIKWLSSNLSYADATKDLAIKFRTYVELSAAYRIKAIMMKHSSIRTNPSVWQKITYNISPGIVHVL
jgi:hypothetical protein